MQGPTIFWEGERARAICTERGFCFGLQGQLDLLSKPLEAEMAARLKAQLQADSAP